MICVCVFFLPAFGLTALVAVCGVVRICARSSFFNLQLCRRIAVWNGPWMLREGAGVLIQTDWKIIATPQNLGLQNEEILLNLSFIWDVSNIEGTGFFAKSLDGYDMIWPASQAPLSEEDSAAQTWQNGRPAGQKEAAQRVHSPKVG